MLLHYTIKKNTKHLIYNLNHPLKDGWYVYFYFRFQFGVKSTQATEKQLIFIHKTQIKPVM